MNAVDTATLIEERRHEGMVNARDKRIKDLEKELSEAREEISQLQAFHETRVIELQNAAREKVDLEVMKEFKDMQPWDLYLQYKAWEMEYTDRVMALVPVLVGGMAHSSDAVVHFISVLATHLQMPSSVVERMNLKRVTAVREREIAEQRRKEEEERLRIERENEEKRQKAEFVALMMQQERDREELMKQMQEEAAAERPPSAKAEATSEKGKKGKAGAKGATNAKAKPAPKGKGRK
jgi:hypothetical protein